MRIKIFSVAAFFLLVPLSASALTTIYLTSGTSWTVPSDWNSTNNTIEVIGGGANGGTGSNTVNSGGGAGAAGGGGGAYSIISNLALTPGGTAYVQIGGVGGDTWLNTVNAAATSTTGGVLAKGASGSTGGASSGGVGSVKYSGGNGGGGGSQPGYASGSGGGGGGGAAGPHGNGASGSGGGAVTGSCWSGGGGGGGGTGDAGNTAANTNGVQWDASHGAGGGGSGSAGGDACSDPVSGPSAGSSGGMYGAGGGGGGGGIVLYGGNSGGAGGAGRQGIIVIKYTPSLPSSSRNLTVSKAVAVVGNVTVSSNITKGSGTFVIDHPLDPENKLLYHSFVESPDALNEYTGTAIIGKDGTATIRLPGYFEALNEDFQYFVRPIKAPMPNLHIVQEVKDNAFVVGGGVPGKDISWMVTGIRHDPYILAHPIIPEVEKGPDALIDKGEYLFAGYASQCTTLIGCAWDSLARWFR